MHRPKDQIVLTDVGQVVMNIDILDLIQSFRYLVCIQLEQLTSEGFGTLSQLAGVRVGQTSHDVCCPSDLINGQFIIMLFDI